MTFIPVQYSGSRHHFTRWHSFLYNIQVADITPPHCILHISFPTHRNSMYIEPLLDIHQHWPLAVCWSTDWTTHTFAGHCHFFKRFQTLSVENMATWQKHYPTTQWIQFSTLHYHITTTNRIAGDTVWWRININWAMSVKRVDAVIIRVYVVDSLVICRYIWQANWALLSWPLDCLKNQTSSIVSCYVAITTTDVYTNTMTSRRIHQHND